MANLLVAEQIVAKYSSACSFCDRGEIKMQGVSFISEGNGTADLPGLGLVGGDGLPAGPCGCCPAALSSSSSSATSPRAHPRQIGALGLQVGVSPGAMLGSRVGPGSAPRRRRRRQRMNFCLRVSLARGLCGLRGGKPPTLK